VHQDAVSIFQSAIDSVRPSTLFPQLLRNSEDEHLVSWQNSPARWLLSIGKAGMSSAEAILRECPVSDYFIVSPHAIVPAGLDPDKIHFGSHPLPDEKSFLAAREMLQWIAQIPDNSSLLVVLSGGTSALVASPADGIAETSKTTLNDLLIRCGASIWEINTVRKHCSRVKGGQTGLAASKLQTSVLVISDVPNDDLSTIGSGPFYYDSTTFIAASEILQHYQIWTSLPKDIRKRIDAGIKGEIPETPKEGSLSIPHRIIASNAIARESARKKAIELGYDAEIIRELLVQPVDLAVEHLKEQITRMRAGSALIFGGEVTVQVRGNGIGGRNQHFALLMSSIIANSGLVFAAAGTDGVDGNSPAAGAWTDGNTMIKANEMRLSTEEFLNACNSFQFFSTLDQSILTGPTGTNVMDLYILLRK
jgi:glycerate-2-kinase